MTEHVKIGSWCDLYHADSVEIVDTLREHAPDAVIMDPPYGIGASGFRPGGSLGATPAAAARGSPKIHGDDIGADLAPWWSFPQVIFWGADHLRRQLPPGGRFLSWDKLADMEPWDDFSDVEFAWHSRRGKATRIVHKWKGLITWASGGEETRGAAQPRREHPMQKPIRVMEWCIEQCRLEPGAVILDPYMGSGTTAIAAFKRKMKFVGCEIDRRWFDVAVERIKRQTEDGPLFEAEPREVATQQTMAV